MDQDHIDSEQQRPIVEKPAAYESQGPFMHSPPSALSIGREALNDAFAHQDIIKKILMPVVSVLVIVTIMDQIFAFTMGQNYIYIYFFIMLMTTWISVQYLMSWHLFSMTRETNYQGTWYRPDRRYVSFFLKSLIPLMAMVLPFILVVIIANIMPLIGLMLMPWACLLGIWAGLRLSFVLPAAALGHTPTLGQAWDLSQGMALKIFWAPIRVLWLHIIALTLYGFVINFALHMVMGDPTASFAGILLQLFLLTIPMMLFYLFFALVGVGVLSRYYLWAIDSRSVVPFDERVIEFGEDRWK